MKLSDLLETITPIRVTGWTQDKAKSPEIGSIHYRAQDVLPGGLFVAIKGLKADGHDFIDDALARGASAIVTEKPVVADSICIEVSNIRRVLASMASRFYKNPSETLNIIGITGTNGKTTTAFLIESILSTAGFAARCLCCVTSGAPLTSAAPPRPRPARRRSPRPPEAVRA